MVMGKQQLQEDNMEQLPVLTYTVKEAMRITNLSRTTLWKAVRSGKLRPCYTGTRRLLFTIKALEEFLGIKKE